MNNLPAYQWILGRDTGISSKTIWAVMMGVITEPIRCNAQYDIPWDCHDFGRCYRLLDAIPEWKARLQEVAVLVPKWAPLIREWARLEELLLDPSASKKFHSLLHALCKEGYTLEPLA